jgi:SAM-dependent methyltransferase
MIRVGTIEQWWERSQRYPSTIEQWWEHCWRYPKLRTISIGFLKPIGYSFILDQIEHLTGIRKILEFGHGFNTTIFSELGEGYEVHGIDDYQALPYFPRTAGWERNYQVFTAGIPHGHFHRGLLAAGKNDLPDAGFDIVCSVSVMEELSAEDLADVIGEAHRVLKPGGYFINSFDFIEGSSDILNNYLALQVQAGFSFDDPWDQPINLTRKDVAHEDQWIVMQIYNSSQPDVGRQWNGNWCTFLTVSRATEFQEVHKIPTVTFGDAIGSLLLRVRRFSLQVSNAVKQKLTACFRPGQTR